MVKENKRLPSIAPFFDLLAQPLHVIILLLIGVSFGVINTLAGGGSILSLPALLILGLSPHAANATNRVAGLVQTGSSTFAFLKGGSVDRRTGLKMCLYGFMGGAVGAVLSLQLSQTSMRGVIQICLLSIALFTLFAPRRLFQDPPPPAKSTMLQVIGGVLVSLYGGFLQAGIGLVSLYYLRFMCGYSLVDGTVYKTIFIGALTFPALVVFTLHGEVSWLYGGVLALGAGCGAWVGVRLTLSPRGTMIIRKALPTTALLMVIGLIIRSWSSIG